MKLMRHAVFVSLAATGACGQDATSVDVTAFIPKLTQPQVRVAPTSSPVGPTAAPVARAESAKPSTYDEALARGRALATDGDTVSAKAMFETAVRFDNKRAEPHIELARLYIAANQRSSAIAEANKAVKLAPVSSQAWNTKGRAELNRFAYDDAIEAFSNAVEIDAGNVWAWNNLGYAELQLRRYDQAAEHLAEATSRPGATGYMFNNLGIALEQLDRLDEARVAFDAGSKLGSKEALSSRKRLEGVKSIALFLPTAHSEWIEGTPDPTDDADPRRTYDVDDGAIEENHEPEPPDHGEL